MTTQVADADQIVGIYQPKDAIGPTITALGVTGSAGAFVSAIQSTLTKQNVGAMSFITRTGGSIALFASMGGTFAFVKNASANLREKDDTWNTTWAGLAAGSLVGLRVRSAPAMLGFGTGLAILMSAYKYTGGRLSGYIADPDVDEVSRKEAMRKNRRRPIEQTVNELGEGRGVYAPGYEQRRAERIKERYGIDVPVQSATS